MISKWHEIWEKREPKEDLLTCSDEKKVFLELKRIAGWDSTGEMLTFEQFHMQYIQIKNELEFCPFSSKHPVRDVFEVGCGSGANLFLFQKDGIQVGGGDYSHAEIQVANSVLKNPKELICAEAKDIPTEIKYDAVMSNSVFSYFDSYDYAQKVLEIMYQKTNYSIGIIDIHDADKKEDFIHFRKQIISDYEERYKDLPKFFYEKSFFLKFAFDHDMSIRFSTSGMKEYWNNNFVFNCFLTKNELSKGD